jgi:mono/diheme cytochrome c family protein
MRAHAVPYDSFSSTAGGTTRTFSWPLVCLSLLLCGILAWPPAGVAQEQEEADPTDVERFTDGDAAAGAKLYKRYCSGCHGADGRGGAQTFMPHVQNLTTKDYIEMVPDGYLYLVIAEGGEAVGKSSMMPAWKPTLSEQDIKDVIAHIRVLPTY